MGTKNKPGAFDCYANAEPDEPMFVLLARDKRAPDLVRRWAVERLGGASESKEDVSKAHEAFECAAAMEEWRKKNR